MSAVADLVRRGAKAPGHLSPLDAVMGEDWAQLKLGKPSGRNLMAVQSLLARDGRRRQARVISPAVARGAPEAVVKLIRRGGVSDRAGLVRQLSYLSRQGTEPVRRSERYFGAELECETWTGLADGWGLEDENTGLSDRTSHFIVTFPAPTPVGAAERAGRAWADEMFASGRFGDCWDYYTVFHTDRAHPHMHVVVNRRGLDAGHWLKISRGSPISYGLLREIQVEAAGREGIDLVATSRLSRAVYERPVSDARQRIAARRGLPVYRPEPSAGRVAHAAASAIAYARLYRADAALLERTLPEMAAQVSAVAGLIEDGRRVESRTQGPGFTADQEGKAVDEIESRRAEILHGLEGIAEKIAAKGSHVRRPLWERSHAEMKANAAVLFPDREDLQAYRQPAERDYASIGGGVEGAAANEARTTAEAHLRRLAEEHGLFPDTAVYRYQGGPVPPVLAQKWRRDEIDEVLVSARRDGSRMDRITAQELVEQFHDRAEQMFARVRRRMLELEAERAFPADPALLEQTFPEVAAGLSTVARVIESQPPGFTAEQEGTAVSEIEQKRAEVLQNFERIDAEIKSRPDHWARPLWERAEAEMKAKAAPLFPDRADFQAHRQPTVGDYAGLATAGLEAEHADSLRTAAEARLRRLAEARGLFPDRAVARYQGGPVPEVLADRWRQDEVNEVLAHRQLNGLDADPDKARQEVEQFHHEAGEMLNRFRARVREVEAERQRPGYGISRDDGYSL